MHVDPARSTPRRQARRSNGLLPRSTLRRRPAEAFTLTLESSTPINAPSSPDASRARGTITAAAASYLNQLTLLTLGGGLTGLAAMRKRRKKN
ncbi:MAG: hypothetical protein U0Y68_12215 [Blastocatellia bacterium]